MLTLCPKVQVLFLVVKYKTLSDRNMVKLWFPKVELFLSVSCLCRIAKYRPLNTIEECVLSLLLSDSFIHQHLIMSAIDSQIVDPVSQLGTPKY